MSLVDELDDSCFVMASHNVQELCAEFESQTGKKPTIRELCELLVWGIRGCSDESLMDINTSNLLELRPKLALRGKVVPKPGDIVAFPSPSGDYHLGVYITKDSPGYAFGLIRGKYRLKPLPRVWFPEIFPYPVYTREPFVTQRRWPIIGNKPELLRLFPSQPEWYHDKADNLDNDMIGRYGSAETPNGDLRDLSQEEGFLVHEFGQGIDEELFEKWLDDKLDR